ncbi:hypothetical protein D9601_08900 [Sphingomonas sp. MA1305]|uniref:hypothetical protein n=1 Tax=Sphingomonas sp. MA1305 TaxID=2479204 RepID=UPI0018DF0EF7|nr:hypothetical protein [Sphingomonas sp. MA1305]MBI0475466.1 hypothetical protein [Sphingomonas sp. MA1305]
MRSLVLAALALPLAACGGGGKEGAGNNSQQAATIQEQVSANLTDDPQNMMVPITPPSPSPIAAIPTAFQGRWGMVANDCDPARADNKGLLTIAGNHLSFYESRGDAAKIRTTGRNRIAFDLPMSGEGMTWSEPTVLTLEGDGRTLIRETTGPADRAGSNRYQKCPA